MTVADELQTRLLMLQHEHSNLLEVTQEEREIQCRIEMQFMVLANEASESIDQ